MLSKHLKGLSRERVSRLVRLNIPNLIRARRALVCKRISLSHNDNCKGDICFKDSKLQAQRDLTPLVQPISGLVEDEEVEAASQPNSPRLVSTTFSPFLCFNSYKYIFQLRKSNGLPLEQVNSC